MPTVVLPESLRRSFTLGWSCDSAKPVVFNVRVSITDFFSETFLRKATRSCSNIGLSSRGGPGRAIKVLPKALIISPGAVPTSFFNHFAPFPLFKGLGSSAAKTTRLIPACLIACTQGPVRPK